MVSMISEDIKKLVIIRLQAMSPNLKLSTDKYGTFTKEELNRKSAKGR